MGENTDRIAERDDPWRFFLYYCEQHKFCLNAIDLISNIIVLRGNVINVDPHSCVDNQCGMYVAQYAPCMGRFTGFDQS